ncbi:hypothetical protein F444_21544 [Phytophthora nicotianae P1976]|uniref:Uncharacterized protein n=1 Tax=Phytophthora nicotianae P1976 TaxID=1317066 RepID=A0A080Z0R9_PHYNI|nr:hypothetical protein F444_21544 [Phytophthora nicotianae P1976]
MVEVVRSALLLVNILNMMYQLSTWSMNYGFALGVQLDACFSFVLVFLLLLRGTCGPVSLPFVEIAIARVVYIAISRVLVLLAVLRVTYCLYMRTLPLDSWPDDNLNAVRHDYFVMDSITWMLQAVVNCSLSHDLRAPAKRTLLPTKFQ